MELLAASRHFQGTKEKKGVALGGHVASEVFVDVFLVSTSRLSCQHAV